MIRIGVIADDLTGAGDTAVQFVRGGWDTELQLTRSHSAAAVVAVTTDSRAMSEADAAHVVADAVEHLRAVGVTRLYKKVDSTLRGHIRAEVSALLSAWAPQALAIVCPAFPATDRTVVDGQMRVGGVPVSETAVARDPVTPVRESHIPTLLGARQFPPQSGETAETMARRLRSFGPIVVVDASSDADLRLLAQAVALLGREAVAVGSAGLARHLAVAWADRQTGAPAIVIVTSQHDVARRQADVLAAAIGGSYQPTAADLREDEAWERWSAALVTRVDTIDSAVLLTAPADIAQNLVPSLIPARFADLVARIFERGRISGVVATGGDGARALVDRLGATGIALEGEVATGVPIGTLIGGRAEGLPVVTKAGAFGNEDALLLAVDAIRSRRRE